MSSTQDLSKMENAIRDALRKHWGIFLFQGIVMLILGILTVAWLVVATVAVDIYVGWLFLISGIVGLVAMFSSRDVPCVLLEFDNGGFIDCGRGDVALETRNRCCVAHDRSHGVLCCRGYFPNRGLVYLSRCDTQLMGLDAT